MNSIVNLRLSKSTLGPAEKSAVLRVLDNEFLGMGAEVQNFEKSLSSYFGREVVCVVNGTAALHLSLQAIGVKAGDEVLVPSLTYVSSFQAIKAAGALPIACDVYENTLTLDFSDVEKKISKRTVAIMPVHYSAGIEDLSKLYTLAKKYDLRVIEDAAHAFGSDTNLGKVGSFGDIVCFSFDGIKNITSGEGGCIITDDPIILQHIKDARLLGVEKDTEKRFTGQRTWDFDVKIQGWRYHMSDIMAAIGIEQLKRFPIIAKKRQEIAIFYDKLLAHEKRVSIFKRDYNRVVPHIYVIRIPNISNKRAELQKLLLSEGIHTGYHYQPNHTHTYFSSSNVGNLDVTNKIFPELLTLPLHEDITLEDVQYVCSKLTSILSRLNEG